MSPTQADIARRIQVWQITRGHPHPGQRYKHGWIPVGGFQQRWTAAVHEDQVHEMAPLSMVPDAGPRRAAITAQEASSLTRYRNLEYTSINRALRKFADKPLPPVEDDPIPAIDAAMERSPLKGDVAVFRGIKSGPKVFGPAWNGDLTGAEWTEFSYLSTSSSEEIGKSFSHDRRSTPDEGGLMEILVPEGTGAIELSGRSGRATEAELLLQRGLKMRVVSDSGPGMNRKIQVEVVR